MIFKIIFIILLKLIVDYFQKRKKVQGWSRKKKEALIKGENENLPELSKVILKEVG